MSAKKCVPGCACRKHVISEAHRDKLRARALEQDHSYKVGMKQSPETIAKRVEKNLVSCLGRDRPGGVPAAGFYVTSAGYRMLTGQRHLLASGGEVLEHRKVLYDKIGRGPHVCHWHVERGCGKTALEWGGWWGVTVDHLDEDRLNNDPDNLAPSCRKCNWDRGNLVMVKHQEHVGV